MKKILTFGFLLFSVFISRAQSSTCIVSLDSIKGSYEGGCSNGKANGEGTAIGIDSYVGTFKNGLPDGKGKYTWKNGDYYYGDWKKGQKDGKGQLNLPVNGVDSVIYGFWKKGVYKGQYENPYIIHNTSSEIGRVEVNKIRGGQMNVAVTVQNLVGGGSIYNSSLITTTRMTDFKVTRGGYMSKSSNALTNKEITTFQGVIFPFRVYLYFGNASVEIEFMEEGSWDIVVPVNK
jgi:hypothetical protein